MLGDLMKAKESHRLVILAKPRQQRVLDTRCCIRVSAAILGNTRSRLVCHDYRVFIILQCDMETPGLTTGRGNLKS